MICLPSVRDTKYFLVVSGIQDSNQGEAVLKVYDLIPDNRRHPLIVGFWK